MPKIYKEKSESNSHELDKKFHWKEGKKPWSLKYHRNIAVSNIADNISQNMNNEIWDSLLRWVTDDETNITKLRKYK